MISEMINVWKELTVTITMKVTNYSLLIGKIMLFSKQVHPGLNPVPAGGIFPIFKRLIITFCQD
jgi:hypothetical protein